MILAKDGMVLRRRKWGFMVCGWGHSYWSCSCASLRNFNATQDHEAYR